MPIDVTCPCGKRIKAKDELAGKRVKCPACGKPVVLAKPEDEPQLDDLEGGGLPSLLDMDDSAFPSAAPVLGNAPAKGPDLGRGGPSIPRATPIGRPAGKSEGIPKSMWLGMGGFLALGVICVIVIAALRSGGDEGEVANVTPAVPAPAGSPASENTPAPSGEPTTSTGDSTTTPAAVLTPTPPVGIDPVKPAVLPATALKPTAMVGLPPALAQWRSKTQQLRGMQRFPDEMHLMGYGWMVQLLPYLNQQELYDHFDFQKSWSETENLKYTSAEIPAFLNPAEPRTRWVGYPFENMGLTHYVGMSGVEDARNVVAAELPRSDPRAGVFGYDAVARPEEITDGAAHTIMVLGSGNLLSPWVQGGGATIRGARAPYFDSITGFGTKGLAKPGTQVLFADGSVRAIPADIDPAVFRAMCTIHGAETVDLDHLEFMPADVNSK